MDLLVQLGERWASNEPAGELVETFNSLDERARRARLAEWLIIAFLTDAALDAGRGPWDAREFISWLEAAGGWITPPITVFELGGQTYETLDMAEVFNWLTENLDVGTWTFEANDADPVKRYRLIMSDGAAELFRRKWL